MGSYSRLAVSYPSTRLRFKAEVIESLQWDDRFAIETPEGVFEMTKREFYTEFPNVVASKSYQGALGQYHYPSIPEKAIKFRR